MNMQKSAGLALILGSLAFLIASFSPISMVYSEPSPEVRLAMIQAANGAWVTSQFLHGLGALVAAVGIVLLSFSKSRGQVFLLALAALVFSAGTIFFFAYVYPRAVDPQGWVYGQFPNPMFLTYTYLTQVGMLLFGLALLRTGFSGKMSWTLAAGAVVLFALTLAFGDMPPFVYYLALLPAGVLLYRNSFIPAQEIF
jgi:hypothetical protein